MTSDLEMKEKALNALQQTPAQRQAYGPATHCCASWTACNYADHISGAGAFFAPVPTVTTSAPHNSELSIMCELGPEKLHDIFPG